MIQTCTVELFHELEQSWEGEQELARWPGELRFLLPSYQRIIGCGPAVLQMLLWRIGRTSAPPGLWFPALRAVTGIDDPTALRAFRTISDMDEELREAHAWISWAGSRGCVPLKFAPGPGVLPWPHDPPEVKFPRLRALWEMAQAATETAFESCALPPYQQVIGMGAVVVPLLLEDMEETKAAHWAWALKAITGADPIPAEDTFDRNAICRAWLAHAREEELID